METVLIITACISIFLIVLGIMSFIRKIVLNASQHVYAELIVVTIGFIGLFLSLIL